MATEYLSEVRSELNSRSTRTTLDELKRKGLEQVRVIRSSQILQLIEQAVDGALARRGERLPAHERDGVVEDSSKILKEMMRAEMATAHSVDQKKIDEMRRAMSEAQTQLAQMQQEVATRDAQLNEAQAKQAELDAELRVIKTRQSGSSPQDLLDELRALRQEIHTKPAAAAPAAAAGGEGAVGIADKLASLGAELSSQIDRIGRKVGVSSAEDEAPTAELANLFASSIPELESNMDSVESEERKGSDVSDALARMKSLRKGRGGA
jgi:Tfp pilus assembly protein FimV